MEKRSLILEVYDAKFSNPNCPSIKKTGKSEEYRLESFGYGA
jgi:hypothetical protein